MKKRGEIVTLVSLKTYLIIGAIGLLLYLGYYFYTMNSVGLINIPTSCPKGIIPERTLISPAPTTQTYTWKDGTTATSFVNCPLGKSEGQNIYYNYCKDLIYYKKIINTDGTIGKEINLKIDLVFNQKDFTSEGYKVIDYKCKS
jgi:hypothetical protein